ncbi:MAG: anthranilate synthase/aminodeoxychorismate synthase-like glutamine amidotransferase [Lentimonas sp.]|jgi:anthranilate synthase/aminodeoxychorismate synthase-like glutamine amidotransferase
MILLIDNYDSFTFNLYHYLIEAGEDEVLVKRNDKITLQEIADLNPRAIIISPGPSCPDNAGICLDVVQQFKGKYPILGVCLGHQVIGQVFGGKIIKSHPMHGKISDIFHDQENDKNSIFKDLKSPFKVTRYHSLIIEKDSIPNQLEITSETKDGIIMAVKHKEFNIHGVQFHPESIASEHGHQLIKNFIDLI